MQIQSYIDSDRTRDLHEVGVSKYDEGRDPDLVRFTEITDALLKMKILVGSLPSKRFSGITSTELHNLRKNLLQEKQAIRQGTEALQKRKEIHNEYGFDFDLATNKWRIREIESAIN